MEKLYVFIVFNYTRMSKAYETIWLEAKELLSVGRDAKQKLSKKSEPA
jgi:hypothetical protein